MKRKFKRPDEEISNKILWIILIIILLIFFNLQRGNSQEYECVPREYDCTIMTSGVTLYSSLDEGITWKTINENDALQSVFEFAVGYECFLQTIEDTTLSFSLEKDSIQFDTMTMHLQLSYIGEWEAEYKMDIWFDEKFGTDEGNKIYITWYEGRERCMLVYPIKSWEIINVPLDIRIDRK